MRLGSLCTGYGGLDMAIEAHYGADLAWYSEIDKDCSQLLAHHWPTQPNLGDLTQIDWNRVDPVDIMCAGFPCQPFSHAGKREGENDDRAIFAYIADAVSVLRPRIVVLENVAGLLTLGGPGVVGTLAGLGYDLRWGIVRASDAGAPHRRARWFCVALSADSSSAARRHVGAAVGSAAEPRERTSAAPTDPDRELREGIGDTKRLARRPDGCTPTDPGGERHGGRQDSRGVGYLDRRDESQTRQRQRPRPEPVDRGSAAATDTDGPGRGEQRRTVTVEPEQRPAERGSSQTEWGQFAPAIQRWETTIGRPAPAPTDDGKLSSRFVEWMMGLPDGHVCGLDLSRTAELKMLGNGVCPQQAALALEVLGR